MSQLSWSTGTLQVTDMFPNGHPRYLVSCFKTFSGILSWQDWTLPSTRISKAMANGPPKKRSHTTFFVGKKEWNHIHFSGGSIFRLFHMWRNIDVLSGVRCIPEEPPAINPPNAKQVTLGRSVRSLSKVFRSCKKVPLLRTFFAVSQSVFSCSRTFTAWAPPRFEGCWCSAGFLWCRTDLSKPKNKNAVKMVKKNEVPLLYIYMIYTSKLGRLRVSFVLPKRSWKDQIQITSFVVPPWSSSPKVAALQRIWFPGDHEPNGCSGRKFSRYMGPKLGLGAPHWQSFFISDTCSLSHVESCHLFNQTSSMLQWKRSDQTHLHWHRTDTSLLHIDPRPSCSSMFPGTSSKSSRWEAPKLLSTIRRRKKYVRIMLLIFKPQSIWILNMCGWFPHFIDVSAYNLSLLLCYMPLSRSPKKTQSHPPSPAVTWMSFLSKESKDFSAPGGWKVDENQILEKPQQLHDTRWGRHTIYMFFTHVYVYIYIYIHTYIHTYIHIYVCVCVYIITCV